MRSWKSCVVWSSVLPCFKAAFEDAFEFCDYSKSRFVEAARQSLQHFFHGPFHRWLAASRVAGMTPHDMLGRLEDRFRLLQTRSPDLPARQRALTGAIEWSHDLLTEDDQRLFSQLSDSV